MGYKYSIFSKRILILCEDEKSALSYFNSFRRDEKFRRDLSSVSVEVLHPKDHSPVGLVVEAKRKKLLAKRDRNPYDEIWIVLDRDGHINFPAALNMATDNGIRFALSIICFEYWILLHFEQTLKPFQRCDELIKYLKKKYLPHYDKAINVFDELKENMPNAIRNGIWVEKSVLVDLERGIKIYDIAAYTNVHHLINRLIEPDKYLFNKS